MLIRFFHVLSFTHNFVKPSIMGPRTNHQVTLPAEQTGAGFPIGYAQSRSTPQRLTYSQAVSSSSGIYRALLHQLDPILTMLAASITPSTAKLKVKAQPMNSLQTMPLSGKPNVRGHGTSQQVIRGSTRGNLLHHHGERRDHPRQDGHGGLVGDITSEAPDEEQSTRL